MSGNNFLKSDLITNSISKVDRFFYTHYENGSQVHQISAERLIEQMIQMLNPNSGDRILEIGTGSGYSTAILSHIVGKNGTVISVDIDPNMVERASQILSRDGCNNVSVFLGNGKIGLREKAPYDKIIAWASAEGEILLPIANQLVSDGIVVCPLREKDNSYIASFRKNQTGELEEIARISGGFIPMTDTPFYPWLEEN
ncbi:Protein-L-isoaspartate(D-aspartate)O-methyltrans ferase [Hyella patelloides LEGE 07179]|uniref:Protein-L-isoaspartate O-methyltransferase n=1 Tax=Hyella patelloides LEGE 07179 TaxID=945734 RepID=A0A563VNK7_9CYAN|nr:methyltransferase domain-containing protein [Hyella patelloides]VEP12865.1 Protein-L-isoaspartate(D-aspartate)O-methyltrans ferase [Hyella patelloides LEGE 07179]